MTARESAQQERVLRSFFGDDGRLHTIPSKHSKLLVVLDRVAQEFEPGKTYSEAGVNDILVRFHPDYAANDFMTREDGHYWRSGGTFEVSAR